MWWAQWWSLGISTLWIWLEWAWLVSRLFPREGRICLAGGRQIPTIGDLGLSYAIFCSLKNSQPLPYVAGMKIFGAGPEKNKYPCDCFTSSSTSRVKSTYLVWQTVYGGFGGHLLAHLQISRDELIPHKAPSQAHRQLAKHPTCPCHHIHDAEWGLQSPQAQKHNSKLWAPPPLSMNVGQEFAITKSTQPLRHRPFYSSVTLLFAPKQSPQCLKPGLTRWTTPRILIYYVNIKRKVQLFPSNPLISPSSKLSAPQREGNDPQKLSLVHLGLYGNQGNQLQKSWLAHLCAWKSFPSLVFPSSFITFSPAVGNFRSKCNLFMTLASERWGFEWLKTMLLVTFCLTYWEERTSNPLADIQKFESLDNATAFCDSQENCKRCWSLVDKWFFWFLNSWSLCDIWNKGPNTLNITKICVGGDEFMAWCVNTYYKAIWFLTFAGASSRWSGPLLVESKLSQRSFDP